LVALASKDSALAQAFEYRFESDPAGTGHPVGNLVLAALTGVLGNFQEALDEAGRLLGAVGRVLPAATEPVVLKAFTAFGEIEGQSAVAQTDQIHRIALLPSDPPAPWQAIEALATADQILIGPGSLYTSVLAAIAVPALAHAIRSSTARTIYIANLRPQTAETEGYDIGDHLAALEAHGVTVDIVVADTQHIPLGKLAVPVISGALGNAGGTNHDPVRLAEVLVGLLG
jgi:uncharacterized cofD-like protein